MAYDGQLKFDTSIDTKGFQQGTNRMGDIIKGNILADAIQKVFSMITGQVDAAMSRLDTMAQFSRVMTTMTGSADVASKALERTNSIVKGTAFGLDTAAKGVQAFVSAGMSVEKATDTIEAWGDAVAFYTKGTNSDLATVENALQKMQTKGTVTMEHLQMLLEAGIPAVQIYAKAVGKSTQEVTKQMGRGELKTDDFIMAMNGAFTTGVEGFPAIAGAAKQAGTSWAGSIDNMKAAITRGVGKILESFDNLYNVKSGMVEFGKFLEKIMGGIAENLDVIVPVAAGAAVALIALQLQAKISTTAIKESFSKMGKAIMSNPIGIIIAGVAAGLAVIDALSNRVDGLTQKFSKMAEATDAQLSANDELLNSLEAMNLEYERTTTQAEKSAEAQSTLVDRLYDLQKTIQSGASSSGEMAAAQREMRQIAAQLNNEIAGLSLEVDDSTGAINLNRKALLQAINAQKEYNKAVASYDYVQQKSAKLKDIEIELYLTETRLEEQRKALTDATGGATDVMSVYQSVTKGNILETWNNAKALMKMNEQVESLIDDQKSLTTEGQATEKMLEEMEAEALRVIQSQDDLGRSVEEVATAYNVSAEEIRLWMETNKKGLQDWTVQQDAIIAEQEAKLEEWTQSVETHTGEVVNDFKELPTELDVTFDEMVDILNENARKYNEWQGLLTQASGKLSAGVLSKLRELGPGTSKILEDIINDTSGKKAAEMEAAWGNAAKAGVRGAQNELGAAYDVGMGAVDMYGTGITDNTTTAQKAAETSVVATLDTMSSSVFESQSKVKSAWETIKTTILVAFRPLVGEMQTVMGNVMQGMIAKMNSMSGALYTKASSIAKGVLNRTKQAYEIHSPSKAMREIYEMVMQGGWVGMNKKEDSLYQKSDEISEGVLQRLAGIPEGLAAAFSSDMSSAIGATHAGLTRTQPIFTSGSPTFAAAAAGNVYETNVTFNEPVNQPDVIARRISQTQRYGLAGRRN